MGIFRRRRHDGTLSPTFTADFWFKKQRVAQDTNCTSKAEALKWVTAKKREILENLVSQRLTRKPKSLSFGTAMDRYVDEQLSLGNNYQTSGRYIVKDLKEEIGAHVPLEEFSTALVKVWVAKELRRGLAPSTVKRNLGILKAMHNHARDVWEYPGLKPIAWRKVQPEIPETEIEIPPPEKIRELVTHATERLGYAIMFAVLTGLRRHEVYNLTVADVDKERQQIRFKGKGKKTVNLPISSAAMSVINSALTSQPSLTQQGQSPKVFDKTNFVREWNEARTRAGIPTTRFHDLRHVFATLVERSTKDPILLMTAMRHSDIDTSLIYVRADKSRMSASLESVAQALQLALPTPSKPSLPWKSEEQDEKPTDE